MAPLPFGPKLPLLSSALAAFLCVLWGANTVAVKFSLSGFGPLTAAAVRFAVSTLILWGWALVSGQPLRPAPGALRPLLINSLLFTLQLTLIYVGFTMTHASRGALLTNLQPFFLLFLAHFFLAGDRITPLKLTGLVLGFSGAACVFLDAPGLAGNFLAGDLLLLASTLVWACSAVYTKHLLKRISSVQIVFYQLLFAVPLFAVGAPVWDAPMVSGVTLEIAAAIVFQGALATAFAFVAWTRLMAAHGAVALHSFVFLIPVSGVLLAGALLDEPISAMILLALALIVAGIVTVQIGQHREMAALLHARSR
ncbi:MAG: DMT family transporter [Desulfobacterales bacterium]|jgi:drug/metabolite transporter (DMT)-like permease|nr:DMT family transporter [Desulfobacterales bacterium]